MAIQSGSPGRSEKCQRLARQCLGKLSGKFMAEQKMVNK
jgi:hypothetical protein